jgi:hypothetical protein
VPQANGKTPAATTTSAGNPVVTREMTLIEMAIMLGQKLTVGELGKDAMLASHVEMIADTYESFAQRKQAKAAASAPKAPAPTPSRAPSKKRAPLGVKAPASAPKRPTVKSPIG